MVSSRPVEGGGRARAWKEVNAAVRGNHGTSGGGRAWSSAWCVPAAAIHRCCVQMLDPACVQPENARAPAAWRGQHEPRHPTRAESSQLPRNDRVRAERSAQREPSGRCHRHTAVRSQPRWRERRARGGAGSRRNIQTLVRAHINIVYPLVEQSTALRCKSRTFTKTTRGMSCDGCWSRS